MTRKKKGYDNLPDGPGKPDLQRVEISTGSDSLKIQYIRRHI